MIALPATNEAVLAGAIDPALDLLPAKMRTDEARCLLLAIGRQESGFDARDQYDEKGALGPALGFWQFERNGVLAVMHNNASAPYLYGLIKQLDIRYGSMPIWEALATIDELAAGCARLLMWADPYPLPKIGDEDAAWELYAIHLWRPGKPDRKRWTSSYEQAVETMRANARVIA